MEKELKSKFLSGVIKVEFNLSIGLTGEKRVIVNNANTAAAVGSGELEVFATPMMVALMEGACCNALNEKLPPGFQTVGMSLEIFHIAPTPINMEVIAKAKLVGIDKRKLTFEVDAYDKVEKVGSGIHQRYIIDGENFMENCNIKLNE